LNIDHNLGLTQLLGQALVRALQLLVLFGQGIAFGFRSASELLLVASCIWQEFDNLSSSNIGTAPF
jgi:hypothetical protein